MTTAIETTQPRDAFLSTSLKVLLGLVAWLFVAMTVVSLGFFDDPPILLIPMIIWSPVLLMAAMVWRSDTLKQWLITIDARWLVGFHLIRLAFGIAFLVLFYQYQALPEVFAIRAGYGDIVAGLFAAGIMVAAPMLSRSARWKGLLVFNIVGFVDIFGVFLTALSIFLTQGIEGMPLFTQFPFNLLPLFIVPMILGTHILLFMRLAWTRKATATEA